MVLPTTRGAAVDERLHRWRVRRRGCRPAANVGFPAPVTMPATSMTSLTPSAVPASGPARRSDGEDAHRADERVDGVDEVERHDQPRSAVRIRQWTPTTRFTAWEISKSAAADRNASADAGSAPVTSHDERHGRAARSRASPRRACRRARRGSCASRSRPTAQRGAAASRRASAPSSTVTRRLARSGASNAVSATSPLPCAKCGSPTYSPAPATCTGSSSRLPSAEVVDVEVAAVVARRGRRRARARRRA